MVAIDAYPAPSGLRELIRRGLVALAVVFTNAGASIIVNRVLQTGTAGKWLSWGTGTTAAAVTDTALQTEAAPTTAGGRTSGAESGTTVTNTNDNYQITGTITAVSTLAITEFGCHDAASAGNLLMHAVAAATNVVSGDKIQPIFGLKFVPQ